MANNNASYSYLLKLSRGNATGAYWDRLMAGRTPAQQHISIHPKEPDENKSFAPPLEISNPYIEKEEVKMEETYEKPVENVRSSETNIDPIAALEKIYSLYIA